MKDSYMQAMKEGIDEARARYRTGLQHVEHQI